MFQKSFPQNVPMYKYNKIDVSDRFHDNPYFDSATLANNGSIHPGVVSQCESKKISTSPDARAAPAKRDLINPDRTLLRTIFTFLFNRAM